MKRVISFLMVLVVALTALNIAAFAADDTALSLRVEQKYGYTRVYITKAARSKVYYTTDGTKPTDKSERVYSSIKLEEPCKLRVVCYLDGKPVKYATKTIKIKQHKLSVKTTLKDGATQVNIDKAAGSKLYYTTDGTKPTDKSKKAPVILNIKEPCKLRIASYIDGKQNDELTANIKVKLKQPNVLPYVRSEMYTYRFVNLPEGVKVYMTQDGSTPSAKNGALIKGNSFQIPKNSSAQLICVKNGWISSDVLTVTSGMTYDEELALKKDKSTFAQQVVDLVNMERVANGLNKLTTYDKLTEVAQLRAGELETKYSHTRPDGRGCFTALEDANLPYFTAGENIAIGYSTPEKVFQGWMNSPGHRANILNPDVTMIGVGFVYDENSADGYYWTQVFIR